MIQSDSGGRKDDHSFARGRKPSAWRVEPGLSSLGYGVCSLMATGFPGRCHTIVAPIESRRGPTQDRTRGASESGFQLQRSISSPRLAVTQTGFSPATGHLFRLRAAESEGESDEKQKAVHFSWVCLKRRQAVTRLQSNYPGIDHSHRLAQPILLTPIPRVGTETEPRRYRFVPCLPASPPHICRRDVI